MPDGGNKFNYQISYCDYGYSKQFFTSNVGYDSLHKFKIKGEDRKIMEIVNGFVGSKKTLNTIKRHESFLGREYIAVQLYMLYFSLRKISVNGYDFTYNGDFDMEFYPVKGLDYY